LTLGSLEEASLDRAAMVKSLGHWAGFRVFVEDHLNMEPDEILLRASWTTISPGTIFAVHLRIYSLLKF
jgi:Xaa-Pro aminopeptidase